MADTSFPTRFRVERMTTTDFSELLRPLNRRGGDLTTAPIAPLSWPVSSADPHANAEALRRLKYSTLQQKAFFDRDPTCHFIKAVTEDGEIASMARWNYFPSGYDFAKHEPVDVSEFVPDGAAAPEGPFEIEMYRAMRTGMMRLRAEWMPKGPSWVLMAMVTRECYRKQGAASMLIRWGVEQARKDRIPALLEASAAGKPVYEKAGFQQVGELVPWDCGRFGHDVSFNIAKMAWLPDTEAEGRA